MPLPEAIIFDLDDPILDDSGGVEGCWQQACAQAASRLSSLRAEALLAAIEKQRDWFWSDAARHREGRLDLRAASRRIVERALRDLGHDQPALARETADAYRDLREQRLRLIPGALKTLEHFRSRSIELGMATNGSAGQRAKIARFGLAKYFRLIIVGEEFGLGKPHREVYEALFQALGADPSKTWAAGDNLEWDVGAPQSLGVYGIWVDAAGAGLPEGAGVPDRHYQLNRRADPDVT